MDFRICPDCRRVFVSRTSCPDCHGQLRLASPDFFLGSFFGKYRLESVLGAGGMGVVYLAEQSNLLRKVALKLILPQIDDPEFRRRFLREARVLAEIRHPNVVEIFDFEVNQWGLPFYVMEYLEGQTLRTLLAREGAIAPSRLLPILRQAASGLSSVHRRGIVHRDLKPANIFLAKHDGGETVKILDFGIARSTDPGEDSRLTRSGAVVGTVNYLAPEQLLEGEIGPAVDQYALALVFIELLSGKAVRAGKTMARIISSEISRPVDISSLGSFPPALIEAVARATMPEPADRHPDILSFVEALEAALGDGEGTGEHSLNSEETMVLPRSGKSRPKTEPGTTEAPSNPVYPRRKRLIPAILISALLLLLVAGGIRLGFRSTGNEKVPPAGEHTLLELSRKIPVPLDSSGIIGLKDGILMMEGMDDLVLLEVDSGHPPSRTGISPEQVVGMTPDGLLLVRRDSRIELIGPSGRGSAPWAEDVPHEEDITFSEDCRFIVHPSGQRLKIWKWVGGRYRPRADLDCGINVGFVALGLELAAVAGDDVLKIFSLERRELIYSNRLTEALRTVAFAEDAGLVALAGWFDSVRVIDLQQATVLDIARRQGADMAVDLLFLDEGPTLAIGERGGLTLWRRKEGITARWDRPGSLLSDLARGSGFLLALDREKHEVLCFSPGGISSARQGRISGELPWAILSDPASDRVLLGLESGILEAASLKDFGITKKSVHTQGITSLVSDGERVASASDDKTIAVWRLPELEVEWRSRAHDYLVNSLCYSRGSHSLYSASSDGKIKKWSWPDLEEVESIDTAGIFGQTYPLHALWVSPDEKTLFLGTWARQANLLRKDASGSWKGSSLPFDSEAGYAIGDLFGVESLLLLGANHPFVLGLYDFHQEKFFRLKGCNRAFSSLVTLDNGRRALVFGENEIFDFRFRRLDDGRLSYRFAVTRHRDLGLAAVSTMLPGDRVAVVNVEGILHIIPVERINGPEICKAILPRNSSSASKESACSPAGTSLPERAMLFLSHDEPAEAPASSRCRSRASNVS